MIQSVVRKHVLGALVLILLVAGSFVGLSYRQNAKLAAITSFDTCAAAGYPIRESYPEQCATPDGRVFTRVIPGQSITVTGQIVCLPHRNTDGPQTLECAFGIRDQNANYYALSDPEFRYLAQLPTGKTATVLGTLTDSDPSAFQRYNIIGTINITSVSE